MKGDQTERSHRSAIKCEPKWGRGSRRQTERRSAMKPGLSGTSAFQRSGLRLKRFGRRRVDNPAPTRVSAGSLVFSTPQVRVTKSDLGGVRSGRGLGTRDDSVRRSMRSPSAERCVKRLAEAAGARRVIERHWGRQSTSSLALSGGAWQSDRKPTALIHAIARNGDRSLMEIDELAHQGQTDTEPFG